MQVKLPLIICPNCLEQLPLNENTITAQSNQNIIFTCTNCGEIIRDIKTSKG